MIIHLKHNIQNICAAFIICQDNIEYFNSNDTIKFIIFKNNISTPHNSNKLNELNITNKGKSIIENSASLGPDKQVASTGSLLPTSNLFDWNGKKRLAEVKASQWMSFFIDSILRKKEEFKPLKYTSTYNIELIDFIYMLRTANIDPSSDLNSDNDKLLNSITQFLISNKWENPIVTFEFASMTHVFGEDVNYVIDCESICFSITEVYRYVYLSILKSLNPKLDNSKISNILAIQDTNIYLFIIIHVLFIVTFGIYINKYFK